MEQKEVLLYCHVSLDPALTRRRMSQRIQIATWTPSLLFRAFISVASNAIYN